MIEGLQVTLSAAKLKALCEGRARHHAERAGAYAEQMQNFANAKIEGMPYTNGDPTKALADKQREHDGQAAEFAFIAEHLDPSESYRLGRDDLHRLGIASNRF